LEKKTEKTQGKKNKTDPETKNAGCLFLLCDRWLVLKKMSPQVLLEGRKKHHKICSSNIFSDPFSGI